MIYNKLGYSFALNITNAFFPLITLPFVFRALNPNIYAEFVIVNILYQLTLVFFSSVFTQHFIRDYSTKKNELNVSLNKLCGQYVSVQMFFSFLAIIFFITISLVYNFIVEINLNVVLCFFLPLVCSAINVEWFYFANQNYRALFFRTITIKVLLVFSVCFFVGDGDVITYSIIMSISYALTYLIGYWGVYDKISINDVSLSNFFHHAVNVKHFALNSIIGVGYQYGDQLLLSIILGKSELAMLSVLKQFYAMAMMVPTTWCRFFLPNAIQSYKAGMQYSFHKKNRVIYSAVVILISSSISILGVPFLRIFAGAEYPYKYIDVFFCSLCIIITAVAVYIDTQVSIPQGLESITTKSNFAVLLVFIGCVYFTVDALSYSGALLSTFISECCGVIIMMCLHYKYKSEIRIRF